jgi:hypothetical protein
MSTKTSERPNGPVAAALLASGIGAAVLGIVTLIYELADQSTFAKSLVWVKPVGALSGKSGLAILAFLVSWLVLHFILKDKEMKFEQTATVALVLLAIGLLGTFPPFWHLLAGG